jgi:hypothetical protein
MPPARSSTWSGRFPAPPRYRGVRSISSPCKSGRQGIQSGCAAAPAAAPYPSGSPRLSTRCGGAVLTHILGNAADSPSRLTGRSLRVRKASARCTSLL